MSADLNKYLASHNYSLSVAELAARIATPSTRSWVADFLHASGPKISASSYYDAVSTKVPHLRALWASLFDDASLDVIALPTTPLPSRPIFDVEPMVDLNGERLFFYEVQGRHFQADCVAGVPGISLPAGVTSAHGPYPAGLPVGLMLQARRRDDARLLAVAAAVEASLPVQSRAPDVPSCAGCTAKLGFAPVSYPPSVVRDTGGTASMAYSPDGYVLGFDGECDAKKQFASPLQSPFATGTAIDWSTRAGEGLQHPTGMAPPSCTGEGTAKDEL